MKVLVTGHLGYIGTVMVPMLLQAGHDVSGATAISMNAAPSGWRPHCPGARHQEGRARPQADELIGFDAVIHLAALSNDPLGDLNADLTYDINHRASVRLARLAK